MQGMTIAQVRRTLSNTFRQNGIDTPELDARILVGHVLGLDHTALATSADRPLNESEARALTALAARRIARAPIARLIGRKEFWGLQLQISPATLVPPITTTAIEAKRYSLPMSTLAPRK